VVAPYINTPISFLSEELSSGIVSAESDFYFERCRSGCGINDPLPDFIEKTFDWKH